MEEDGFYDFGSDSDGPPPLERVYPGEPGTLVADMVVVPKEEVAAAKAIIEEKLQRSKSVKVELDKSDQVDGDVTLDFLIEKCFRYINKHPDLFTEISASVLERGVLKTICIEVLPTLTSNAALILQKAPTLLQDIKTHPRKYIRFAVGAAGVTIVGGLLLHFGIIGQDQISTLFNVMIDPANGTAVEL